MERVLLKHRIGFILHTGVRATRPRKQTPSSTYPLKDVSHRNL